MVPVPYPKVDIVIKTVAFWDLDRRYAGVRALRCGQSLSTGRAVSLLILAGSHPARFFPLESIGLRFGHSVVNSRTC